MKTIFSQSRVLIKLILAFFLLPVAAATDLDLSKQKSLVAKTPLQVEEQVPPRTTMVSPSWSSFTPPVLNEKKSWGAASTKLSTVSSVKKSAMPIRSISIPIPAAILLFGPAVVSLLEILRWAKHKRKLD